MSDIHNEIILELRNNLKRIISLMENEKQKNVELKSRNSKLERELRTIRKSHGDLENENKNIKLAKAITASSDSSHDAKIKVNRIVREIDKCIALLNR
jgi:hypothetical protein